MQQKSLSWLAVHATAAAARGKTKRKPASAQARGKPKLGALPEWNLADLYAGPDAPALKADLQASEHAADAMHAWESSTLPATLTLTLPAPAALREIHLTFDSGFSRQLCLSASDATTRLLIRGAQPEIVKHYRVLIDSVVVVEEKNNFLRKRIHQLPGAVSGRTVAVECLATQGAPQARIFEVRLYA